MDKIVNNFAQYPVISLHYCKHYSKKLASMQFNKYHYITFLENMIVIVGGNESISKTRFHYNVSAGLMQAYCECGIIGFVTFYLFLFASIKNWRHLVRGKGILELSSSQEGTNKFHSRQHSLSKCGLSKRVPYLQSNCIFMYSFQIVCLRYCICFLYSLWFSAILIL